MWLGIYRPESSNILEDLRYYSDGKRITYQNWVDGDPDNAKNKERCVAAVAYRNYKWGDVKCGRTFDLICEL